MRLVTVMAYLVAIACPVVFVLCLIGLLMGAQTTGLPPDHSHYLPPGPAGQAVIREFRITVALLVASPLFYVATLTVICPRRSREGRERQASGGAETGDWPPPAPPD